MKIVVTGATGLIGRAFVSKVHNLGYELILLSKNGGLINSHNVDPVNLLDISSLEKYFENKNADIVVHLACNIPISKDNSFMQNSFFENVIMTSNLLKVSLGFNAKLFINLSGINIYNKKSEDFIENDVAKPCDLYAASKYMGEILCEQLLIQKKIQTISLRVSSPYDYYYRRMSVIHRFVQAAIKGDNIILWGAGKRGQDFVFAGDVGNAISLAIENNASGVMNIASGQTVSMLGLAKKVIEIASPTNSKIRFADKVDPEEYYHPKVNISLAEKILGYHPKYDIDKGLKYLVARYREDNKN